MDLELAEDIDAAANCPWVDQHGNLWWVRSCGEKSEWFLKAQDEGFQPVPILADKVSIHEVVEDPALSTMILGWGIMFNQNLQAALTVGFKPWEHPESTLASPENEAYWKKKMAEGLGIPKALLSDVAAVTKKQIVTMLAVKNATLKHKLDPLFLKDYATLDALQIEQLEQIHKNSVEAKAQAVTGGLHPPSQKQFDEMFQLLKVGGTLDEVLDGKPIWKTAEEMFQVSKIGGTPDELPEFSVQLNSDKAKPFLFGQMSGKHGAGAGKSPVFDMGTGKPMKPAGLLNDYAAKDADAKPDFLKLNQEHAEQVESLDGAQPEEKPPFRVQYLAGSDKIKLILSPASMSGEWEAVDQFGGIWIVIFDFFQKATDVTIKTAKEVDGYPMLGALYTKKKYELAQPEQEEEPEEPYHEEPEESYKPTIFVSDSAELPHHLILMGIYDPTGKLELFDSDGAGSVSLSAIADLEANPVCALFSQVIGSSDDGLLVSNKPPILVKKMGTTSLTSKTGFLVNQNNKAITWGEVDGLLLSKIGDYLIAHAKDYVTTSDLLVLFGKLSHHDWVYVTLVNYDVKDAVVQGTKFTAALDEDDHPGQLSHHPLESFCWTHAFNNLDGFTLHAPTPDAKTSMDQMVEWDALCIDFQCLLHSPQKLGHKHLSLVYHEPHNPYVTVEDTDNDGWATDISVAAMKALAKKIIHRLSGCACVLFGQTDEGATVVSVGGLKVGAWLVSKIDSIAK